MSSRRTFIASIVLFILPLLLITLGILITTPVFSQENENATLSVSPGAFTASDVPPFGRPYTIPEVIVIRNGDNIARVISITSEIPTGDITPGYAPIPNENWIIPVPSSVLIDENSFAKIKISINIPRLENYTSQKWEVWISVERQPLPGEIGVISLTVVMDIETTSELPQLRSMSYYLALLISVILVILTIVSVAWILSRSRGRVRRRPLLRGELYCGEMFRPSFFR